ncbi:CTP:tRNA cytidylyltransferase [Aureococcus anophagefferens]|uniref:CTP:tRNA cytidylyltransferase n=2 Tax=Aureococcus anophagefferens TaxID=44056 RepID=A0ABR1FT33_AURAN
MTATVESADLANAFVELTKEEAELVEVLCAAAAPTGTTVRICGGWVRDKALGRVTKDVDVALDNVSGAAFAARVSEALAARGGDRGSNIGVIAANPEQSKHLETATMRLCGIEVDFVNLRSESYADAGDTRIPTMTFGTPEQDALRRDFTLNALFFNVHSRAIEDYTKRGWDDLRTGIMRTPLEPRVTLLDDPLRALRGVRFASRYCFALEQGFVGACLLPEVRAALLAKVSRERVGKEVWGALATSPLGSARAVDEFRKLQLASPTFRGCVPPESACAVVGHAHAPSGARVPLSAVFAEERTAAADSPWLLSARCVRALADAEVAAADAVDRDAAVVAEAGVAAKKRRTPLPSAVCKDGLKLPGRTVQDAQKVLDAAPKFASLAKRLDAKLADDGAEPWGDLRRDAGLVLFDVKRNWRTALRVAKARVLAYDAAAFPGGNNVVALDWTEPNPAAAHFDALEAAILGPQLHLDGVWDALTPLLDGNKMSAALGVPKGPAVGELMKAQRSWQLANPTGDVDACVAHLGGVLARLNEKHAKKKPRQR